MFKQLTMGNILAYADSLYQDGMEKEEIEKLPIYIGNDEELNGVHSAWYCDLIFDDDISEHLRELICEDSGSIKLADDAKAILIS